MVKDRPVVPPPVAPFRKQSAAVPPPVAQRKAGPARAAMTGPRPALQPRIIHAPPPIAQRKAQPAVVAMTTPRPAPQPRVIYAPPPVAQPKRAPGTAAITAPRQAPPAPSRIAQAPLPLAQMKAMPRAMRTPQAARPAGSNSSTPDHVQIARASSSRHVVQASMSNDEEYGEFHIKGTANLRDISTKKKSGESVDFGDIVVVKKNPEQLKFSDTLLGIVPYVGTNHFKVSYNGKAFWLKESVIGSEKKKEILVFKEKTLPIFIGKSFKDNEGIEQEFSPKISKTAEFFTPNVAKVSEENKMDGGNYSKFKIGISNLYKVKVKNGHLVNRNGQKISGAGAWVLDRSKELYGSQGSSDNSYDSDLGFDTDMSSHLQSEALSPYWAGEMVVKDGKVTSINNQSGGYHLEAESNKNILIYLLKDNVISQKQVDEKMLSIEAWKQTGMDREGNLTTWKGFKGN